MKLISEAYKSMFTKYIEIGISIFIHFEVFIKRKLRACFLFSEKSSLLNKDFIIISNNCFGGQAYQWFKLPYNSPFIGMFLYGPCYLKLLQNFNFYINQNLVFINESAYKDRDKTYPVALLHDIELHFSHYSTEQEVCEKWYRRRERLISQKNYDNFYFVISDRERVDTEIIKEFHKLDFKNKLSFAVYNIDGLKKDQHINVFKKFNQHMKTTPNGKKMFKISFLYLDFVKWLNTQKVIRTRFQD